MRARCLLPPRCHFIFIFWFCHTHIYNVCGAGITHCPDVRVCREWVLGDISQPPPPLPIIIKVESKKRKLLHFPLFGAMFYSWAALTPVHSPCVCVSAASPRISARANVCGCGVCMIMLSPRIKINLVNSAANADRQTAAEPSQHDTICAATSHPFIFDSTPVTTN